MKKFPIYISLIVIFISISCSEKHKKTSPAKSKPAVKTKVNKKIYEQTFLIQKDLPVYLKKINDLKYQGVSPEDTSFRKNNGISAGLTVWGGKQNDLIWRLVDVRWMLSSPEEAKNYFYETLKINSEGFPEIKNTENVGEDCKIYGGVTSMNGISLLSYFYLFRINNVIYKIYVAKGPLYKLDNNNKLLEKLTEITKHIAVRVSKQGINKK